MTKNKKPKVTKKKLAPVKLECPACGSKMVYITKANGITCRNCGYIESEEKTRITSKKIIIDLLKFGLKKIKIDEKRVVAHEFMDEYIIRIKKVPTFEGFSDEEDDE